MSESISPAQAEIARQVLNDGNPQVETTLRMLFGETPRQFDLRTRMLSMEQIRAEFGTGPLVTVRVAFAGDLRGVFLFLQRESEFARLRNALQHTLGQPARTGNEETDYLVPDWLQDRQAQAGDDRKIRDALGEMGNVLLGGYLTAVYSRCTLATFQELPETKVPDRQQEWLQDALNGPGEPADRVFAVEVTCAVRDETFTFFMLTVIERDDLLGLLEKLRQR